MPWPPHFLSYNRASYNSHPPLEFLRIDQPGYKTYSKLEDLLVKAANKEEIKEEIKFVTEFYKDDFNEGQLKMQLEILSSNIPNSSLHNLSSVLQYLKSLSSSQQALISEVCTLAALIIVMPATNATSERTFSCLRRIKSYLSSSMTQTRLNSTMIILSVHKEYTDQLFSRHW